MIKYLRSNSSDKVHQMEHNVLYANNFDRKKQLEKIIKRINFKRLQDLSKMEELIDNGREKFWRFTELGVTLKDIFLEIAKRNYEESDPNKIKETLEVNNNKKQNFMNCIGNFDRWDSSLSLSNS